MNKLFKLIGIFFGLSLLALALGGCMEGSSVLTLKVDTPAKDTSVATPTVTVSGRVAGTEVSSAKLIINDAEVPVKDGKFVTAVNLIEGKNIINIGATTGTFSLKEPVTVTYVPAKQ
jgi:hypothetical protein